MNERILDSYRNIYSRMGFNEESIKNRIEQVKSLAKHNPEKSDNWKGGGVSMAYDSERGASLVPIVVHDLQEATRMQELLMPKSLASDVDTFGFDLPSSGVPLPLLTTWTTRMVEQIFKKPTLSKLTDSWQQGAPGVREIKIPTIGLNGYVDIYDDFSAGGNTSINANWVNRSVGYFEQTLGWGTLQAAEFGLAKIDYTNKLREALAVNVAQFQNDLGFQGYTGIPETNQPMIWGILNEPNLNPAITLPADGQIPGTLLPTTSWVGKDYSQILRDVQLLVGQVLVNGLGTVTTEDRFILALPPSAEVALLTSTPYGITVKEQLRKMFPKIEFVVTSNFEASLVTTGEEVGETVIMVLFANPSTGEMPYSDLFVTKWWGHRPHTMPSSIIEKMAMALAGSMLKYPLYVSHSYGV